jgi:S1-C subfamily serine protease
MSRADALSGSGSRRPAHRWPPTLALALLIAAGLACSAPSLVARPTAMPIPTQTPIVVTVVVTPPPGSLPGPIAAENVEAQRIAIYERTAPAVVNITTQLLSNNFFFGAVPEEGSGSGFLWDNSGNIVTNFHVVQGAQSIAVSFGGEDALTGKVVGSDPLNDLAVIHVDNVPKNVQPLVPGDSAALKVGQSAIAIGNPFGQFERTLTVGVVSALNRTIETDSAVLRGVIQTDASINRGNSGGPLLDSAGKLIGVNSAIYSPTGTSAGVGLAIPVDKVKRVVPVLIKEGHYPHPWLGVEELGYEVSPALSRTLDLGIDHGLLIAQLYRDSPAAKAGVRAGQRQVRAGNRRYQVGGDILLAIDGKAVNKWLDVSGFLEERTQVGQTITLRILRDGKEQDVKVVLADMPDSLLPS